MASTTMHMAIAKLLENDLNIKNKNDYFLGTVVADIAKQVNFPRDETHFIKNKKIDIESFKKKYPNYKEDNFLLGYYIHLYTDILWEKFLNELFKDNKLTFLNNKVIDCNKVEFSKIMYKDYEHLNAEILSEYNLTLKLFYTEIDTTNIKNFKEIPIDKINEGIEKLGILIKNSINLEEEIFNIDKIKKFINTTSITILDNIKEIEVI